jgi:hypothetical protein
MDTASAGCSKALASVEPQNEFRQVLRAFGFEENYPSCARVDVFLVRFHNPAAT